MRILLDTSLLIAGERDDFDLAQWVSKHGHEVLICDATITEYLAGQPAKDEGKKKRWQSYFETFVNQLESVPLDRQICERAGELLADARSRGKTLPLGDGYHAAVAELEDLTVATLDTEHFSALGVRTVNPLN